MNLLIADTGPVNDLVLIEAIDLLPRLFDRIIIPVAVQRELMHPGASEQVRAWVTGTLGLLEITAQAAMIDLQKAFDRLWKTNFHAPNELMQAILRRQ